MSDWLQGTGEMAERIRAHDWPTTPIGPMESWPQSLRVVTRLLLDTRYPMFLWWGPELIQLYNDACRDAMGPEKHPAALGGRGRDTWAEIWDIIGPQIAQVMAGGAPTWHEDEFVPVTRHGDRRAVWWTYSFSPIEDAGAPNGVGGVLVIGRDVTQEHMAKAAAVESEARQAFLLALSDALRPLSDPVAVQQAAMKLLAERLDVMRASYFEVDADQDGFILTARHERNPVPIPERMRLSDFSPGMAQAYRAGRPLVYRDTELEAEEESQREAYRAIGIRAWTAVPLVKDGLLTSIVGVHSTKPRDWTGAEVRLIEDVAERTWAAVERARAEAALRESEERKAFLLAVGDVLEPLTDAVMIQEKACRLLADRLSADRAYYVEIDEAKGIASIRRDHVRWPSPSLAGEHPIASFLWAVDVLRHGTCHAIEDVRTSPLVPDVDRLGLVAWDIVACMGIPLVKEGRLVGALCVTAAAPRSWSRTEVDLLRSVGERIWAAVERAHAEAELRTSEELRRVAVEGGGMGTWRWDVASGLIWSDATQLSLWGFPPSGEPLHLDRFASRIAPKGQEELAAIVARAIEAGESFDGQLEVSAGPTKGHWVRWRGRADPERPNLLNGVSFDVTEQRAAEAALRDSEVRQAFLLKFSDALRAVADPLGIQHVAMQMLSEHLNVSRAFYFFVERTDDGLYFTVETEHRCDTALASLVGRHRMDDFHGPLFAPLSEGEPIVVPDIAQVPGITADVRRLYRAVDVAAFVNVPLVQGRVFVAGIGVHEPAPRGWQPAEVELLREVGERTWSAVERARAEAALRDSEEQQRLTMQLVPAMLWWADPAGHDIIINDRWRFYTGQGQTEVRDFGWLDAIHPDDVAATRAAFAHAFATGEPVERQQRIRQAKDGYRWHLVRHVPVRDRDGAISRWFGAAIDVHDLHVLQDRQHVLVAELQHRTRNLMGVVQSMFEDTLQATDDMQVFVAEVRDRLRALGRVQGLLSRLNGDRVTFDALIRDEMRAIGAPLEGGKVTLAGPPGVALRSSTVQTFALAIHELATNALKYGALKQPGGRLAVAWRLAPVGPDGLPWLHVDWRESGVAMPPADAAPQGTGQGRQLIEHALPYQLGAITTYVMADDGVRCSIAVPVPSRTAAEDTRNDDAFAP